MLPISAVWQKRQQPAGENKKLHQLSCNCDQLQVCAGKTLVEAYMEE
jgi:hypothetical protein